MRMSPLSLSTSNSVVGVVREWHSSHGHCNSCSHSALFFFHSRGAREKKDERESESKSNWVRGSISSHYHVERRVNLTLGGIRYEPIASIAVDITWAGCTTLWRWSICCVVIIVVVALRISFLSAIINATALCRIIAVRMTWAKNNNCQWHFGINRLQRIMCGERERAREKRTVLGEIAMMSNDSCVRHWWYYGTNDECLHPALRTLSENEKAHNPHNIPTTVVSARRMHFRCRAPIAAFVRPTRRIVLQNQPNPY